jgi:phage-related minor tail protein
MAIEAGFLNVLIAPKLVENFGNKLGADLDKQLGPVAEKTGKTFSENLASGLNKAGKGLTAGVTAPLLALGGTAVAVGMEIDGAFDAIRVGTGASGKELEGLQESFRNVAKTSTQSFESVGSTITTLNQTLGLTGKPLEELATQLLNIQQITGQAADTEQVTKFFNAFNIGAEDQTKTLDQLFVVSQKTGLGFNELLSGTLGQASAFQTLGFGAVEAAAFVGQLEKAGANSGAVLAGLNRSIAASVSGDKAAEQATKDLVKAQEELTSKTLDLQVAEKKLDEVRANPKAKESDVLAAQNAVTKLKTDVLNATNTIAASNEIISKKTGGVATSTKDFFASTVAEIENLIKVGDEAGAQALAKDIFGAKGFNTVITQIKEGTFNIQEFTNEVINSTETINGLAAETADFPEQLAQLKNQSKLALEPIANVLLPAITSALQAVQPFIEKFSNAFGSLSPETARLVVIFGGIAAAVGPALLIFAKIVTSIQTITAAVKLLNLTVLFNPWVLAAAAAIAAIVLIVKNWDSISAYFQELWDGIVIIFEYAVEKVVGFFDSIGEKVSNLVDGIKERWNNLVTNLTDKIKGAVETVNRNWESIKERFRAAVEFIKNLVSTVGNFLLAPFKTAGDNIIKVFTSVKDFVIKAIQAIPNAIINAFKTLQSIIAGALNYILKLPGFAALNKIFGAVSSGFGKIFGGARAEGGPVDASKAYLIGEKGPEIFVPKTGGMVLPNNVLSGLIGTQSGGAAYTVNVYNPVAEPSSASIPAALRRANLLRSTS